MGTGYEHDRKVQVGNIVEYEVPTKVTYEYKTIEAYSHHELPGGCNARMPDGEGWRVIKIVSRRGYNAMGFVVVFERRKSLMEDKFWEECAYRDFFARAKASGWLPMSSAPRGRPILARRHNDCFFEYHVVWWSDDHTYPWASDNNAFPSDRLDDWHEIPE